MTALKLILKIVIAPVILRLTLAIWICVGLVYVSGLVLGASQYGDRPAGRRRPGDILPAERPYSAGDRVSHKPLWAAEVGLLAAGQGAGSSVFSARYNLWIE